MTNDERILVIEDDSEFGEVLREGLKLLGYESALATFPEQGLQLIQQAQAEGSPFTVASVDKMFEVGGRKRSEFPHGQGLVKEIKERYPYIATIMVTSQHHTPQEVLKLRDDYCVDQFMHKDEISDLNVLQTAIERATSRVERNISSGQIPYEPTVTPKRYTEPEVIMAKPVFGIPQRVATFACDVFMIMPFAEEFQHVYADHIKPVVEETGLTIKRGDAYYSGHVILTEIWSSLYSCQFVIAEVSGQNANVYYELGMAHTLGKTAIILMKRGDQIPFDIRGRRVIRYDDTLEGLLELEQQLRKAMDDLAEQAIFTIGTTERT